MHCQIARFPYYRPFAKRYYHTKKRDVDSYDIPMAPFERRWIDPNKIEHITGYSTEAYLPKFKIENIGAVKEGNWDKNNKKFNDEKGKIYTSIQQRFKKNVDWFQTPYVKEAVKKIQMGESAWHNCTSRTDIEQRCRYIESIYNSMKHEGYKTQKDINTNLTYPREIADEILIDICREGNPLFFEGKHRLSIAKILDIETIPVVVRIRHKKWMEKLEDQYQVDKLPDHIDVAHLKN